MRLILTVGSVLSWSRLTCRQKILSRRKSGELSLIYHVLRAAWLRFGKQPAGSRVASFVVLGTICGWFTVFACADRGRGNKNESYYGPFLQA